MKVHQSFNICTGKNMNHKNTQNQRKCIKIDTMYNSYEENCSQFHIKWRKRNWKSPVNGPNLNLKFKMAAKIRIVHLWRFVAVYLWKSITCIYCMCLPFIYGAKVTVLKEKEKHTRKHTTTKRMSGTECVWDVKISAPDSLIFRSIVARPICETHRLSNFIDKLLQPYSKHVKTSIKNTTDFLTKQPQSTDPNAISVYFVVERLYTNNPQNLGLEASFGWKKYPQELPSKIGKNFILDGIKFILENNYFCFNENYFLQIKRTAMGTKFVPTYATLVLAYLEEKHKPWYIKP